MLKDWDSVVNSVSCKVIFTLKKLKNCIAITEGTGRAESEKHTCIQNHEFILYCNPLSRLRAYICLATGTWNIHVPFDNMEINSGPWYMILYAAYPTQRGHTLTGCPSRPAIWLAIIVYPTQRGHTITGRGRTLTGYHKTNRFQFNLPKEEGYL